MLVQSKICFEMYSRVSQIEDDHRPSNDYIVHQVWNKISPGNKLFFLISSTAVDIIKYSAEEKQFSCLNQWLICSARRAEAWWFYFFVNLFSELRELFSLYNAKALKG